MPVFQGKKTDKAIPVAIERERYTEGDSSATLEGGVMLAEGAGNIVYPVKVDASGYLEVSIGGGVTPGTEYFDGDLSVGSKGTLIMGDDGSNVQNIVVDAAGHLQVDVLDGAYDGIQYQDGAAVAVPYGYVVLGHDGSNVFPLAVDGTGRLYIAKPATPGTVTDVQLTGSATTLIVAVSVTRHCVLIGNLAGNSSIFRVGDSSAGASRGAELAPGESVSIETTGAIYGYNPGANQSVSVLWVSV